MPEMIPGRMGYDRTIVVFSPDGRLLQVEYAQKAVDRGTTVVGIKYAKGVGLLAIEETGKLSESADHKIAPIDDHLAATFAGLPGDARVLIEQARIRAQIHQVTYEEPADPERIASYIGDLKQQHTRYAGLRPMGVNLLIAGQIEEPKLFEVGPGGTLSRCKAQAIGRGAGKAKGFLKKKWKAELSKLGALKLGVQALHRGEEKAKKENVAIALIEKGKFRRLSEEELKEILKEW